VNFIVPKLEQYFHGKNQFGACVIPQAITDPGGVPGIGIVHLRGAVAVGPEYKSPAHMPTMLFPVFTLPAGMRPRSTRWLLCWVSSYAGMYNSHAALCVIHTDGRVEVQLPTGVTMNVDGAIFFDGISFIAEQ
jgi:hypothetical protein